MTNKLKNKRGFSLVELMVVVAIMGTLASIAIPAFNEYRKSAKKASYRTDLSSLHKSWLAFGVEIDSFCDRDSRPRSASFQNIGMESLLGSKLYGTEGCSEPGVGQGSCNTTWDHDGDGSSSNPTAEVAHIWRVTGPGKHNFIGFGTEACADITDIRDVQIIGAENGVSTDTSNLTRCSLNVDSYRMGVYGHLGGTNYFGISITNNGVFSDETEGATGVAADANCV